MLPMATRTGTAKYLIMIVTPNVNRLRRYKAELTLTSLRDRHAYVYWLRGMADHRRLPRGK